MSFIRWLSAGAIAGFTASGAMVADFRATYAADNDAKQLLSEAHGIFKPLPNDMATPEFPITPERVDLGRKLFYINTGCIACHNGPGVGGGMFQKFGVVEDYWKETGSKEIDNGRFDVTHDQADMYVFKVPTLRNVAMTPPYFHDGSVGTLPEAVTIMAKVQLGKALSDQDVSDIVAFLQSLTGKLPDTFASAPILPIAGFEEVKNGSTEPPQK